MGAESDPIFEQFVPSEEYRAEQLARARALMAAGMSAERVAQMLSIPLSLLSEPTAPDPFQQKASGGSS